MKSGSSKAPVTPTTKSSMKIMPGTGSGHGVMASKTKTPTSSPMDAKGLHRTGKPK